MPNPPFVPQLIDTGDVTKDALANIDIIHDYLYTLSAYLAGGEPDAGWSTSGVVSDKSLTVGDSLANTQHFLGTLVQLLITKGVLSA